MHVPTRKVCVVEVSILSLSTIFRLHFGTVPPLWYVCFPLYSLWWEYRLTISFAIILLLSSHSWCGCTCFFGVFVSICLTFHFCYRWFQSSHCELSIYMYQHSNIACIWDDHSVLFLSWFPWYMVAANQETVPEPRVLMLKSSVRNCHGHHITWLTATEYICHKCHGHHISWLTVTKYLCHKCHGHHLIWLTVTEYLCHKCHGHHIIWLTVMEYMCHKCHVTTLSG